MLFTDKKLPLQSSPALCAHIYNYNLIFLLGLILSIYDTTFFLKGIDTEIGAKNSITDLIIGAFTLVASIILIIGLSDKIYI